MDIQYMEEARANTGIVDIGSSTEAALATLDQYEARGMGAIVTLYTDMKPAGNPINLARTKEKVAAVKDHPAVIGYNVMDEPYLHGSADEVSKDLEASYTAIRDIDPVHPVILLETWYNRGTFDLAAKYCDVIFIDPYPSDKTKIGNYTEEFVKYIKNAAGWDTSVHSVIQAFDWQGYLPSANDIRVQVYSSFFAGADGLGYFRFRNWNDASKSIWTYDGEDGMWTGVKAFGQTEQEDAINLFTKGKYPVLDFVINDELAYILYAKDNVPYLIVLNKTNEPIEKEIPLASYDGSVTIGAFTAEAVDISGAPNVSGNGTFKVTLPETTVAKYKITPSAPLTLSDSITPLTYRDLYAHNWAREAIETLTKDGIIEGVNENAFRPGRNITRGEFASFLVKTLGLTAETTENFKDVADCAEYAEEVAIGRALGILNGVGDNCYRPETQITRQDLMTITARALNLDGTMDLSAFSDADLIAEYAEASIQGMVESGLVQGNADGTLNPLGNTTRAEAAVIMHRISESK